MFINALFRHQPYKDTDMTEAIARPIPAEPTFEALSLDEQNLATFLSSHPDFLPELCASELMRVLQALLQQRPDLFAELKLPQPPDGVASLPHAQLRIWREQLTRLNSALRALRATAESNAALDRVVHEFACALLTSNERSPAQVMTLIHRHFAVDTAQLIACSSLEPKTQHLLEGWLASRTPLCGRLSEPQRQALFGAALPDTGSAALIAIGAQPTEPRWILALGRFAPEGFNPSQGTLFLTQIGDLVHAFLPDACTASS